MMQTIEEVKQHYRKILKETQAVSKEKRYMMHFIGTFRLVVVLGGIGSIVLFWHSNPELLALWGLLAVALFLHLGKQHDRFAYNAEGAEATGRICEQELQGLEGHYEGFDGGDEYIDASHPFTTDLDVFGPHSLFQSLNRTVTPMGKRLLAHWMQQPLDTKEDIEGHQLLVREMAADDAFCRLFRSCAQRYKGAAVDEKHFYRWAATPTVLLPHKLLRWASPAVAAANLLSISLAALGVIPWTLAALVWALAVVAGFLFTKKISRLQNDYDSFWRILHSYGLLLTLIANNEAEKGAGGDSHKREYCAQGSKAVEALGRLMKALDQRNNVLVCVLLNGLFFWEVRQMLRIERWKQAYGVKFALWLQLIGLTDALCSLGTFVFNHPHYHFPTLTDKPFTFEATGLGHPLMPVEQCVTNDVDIPVRPFFLVITGANMAGKSTYLRSIGANHLLACMGLPVCAASLTLHPAHLVTSLRTDDSLARGESYFFAELKRLKGIIEQLQAGKTLFILLDEILKGTNSRDKQKGSLALVRQLVALNTNGVIATHDVLLGTLAESFPDHIRNYCFEAEITGDRLSFSYKLKAGVAQNMNASFLMQQMGITGL
ncbi:MAG: hypothetical protein LBM06_08255 [Prevotellaceae bacterium]|jgi:hypothetical protein|nr:hypothetical protein [Prevotellaceae bacterium]